MRGIKRTVPLFIECRREGCGQLREVHRPYLQRKGGFCSKRCAGLVLMNVLKAEPGKGGRISGRHRQQRVLQRLNGLSKLACFRLGYVRGLGSKLRQLKRRKAA